LRGVAPAIRSLWRGRRPLRLAACASVLLVGSALPSVLVPTAMAEDLPPPPAPSAQTDLDGAITAPVASPESAMNTEVTSDAAETPVTTADGSESSTGTSATASDTTGTSSSSTDTSSTDTSTPSTEGTADNTSEGTNATDSVGSSCTTEGATIAPDAADMLDGTTDGTDAAPDATGTTATAADTTGSTHSCDEAQASADSADSDSAAVPTAPDPAAPAPTDAATDAPASPPTTQPNNDRALQSADAPTASSVPEIATASPTGDAQSSTDVAGEMTPAEDDATVVAVGQTLDVRSWTGSFGAGQWHLERRFTGCLSALPAEGCAVSYVFVGQRGVGVEAAYVRERSPTEARGGARTQRSEAPRRRAPDQRFPVPTMPGTSVGAGASEGFHGGAVLGLISAVLGLLALAGIRAVAHLERRPPTPALITLLERPG
jgi:hypothetical protein